MTEHNCLGMDRRVILAGDTCKDVSPARYMYTSAGTKTTILCTCKGDNCNGEEMRCPCSGAGRAAAVALGGVVAAAMLLVAVL